MTAALSGLASERLLALADTEPGAVVEVTGSKLVDVYRFTKLDDGGWIEDQGHKSWTAEQFAAILHSIGGQQTIHIPMKSHASNPQP